ncbi:MAG: hypothetical protein ABI310_06315 [Microbacteriaceae bacterium]
MTRSLTTSSFARRAPAVFAATGMVSAGVLAAASSASAASAAASAADLTDSTIYGTGGTYTFTIPDAVVGMHVTARGGADPATVELRRGEPR